MPQRVFLGWDQPFLLPAIDWLLARKSELPRMLIVVPTAQSGRRLRETLAEAGGAILAPEVVTPGSLLQPAAAGAAPDWIEQIAWAETFEAIRDWSLYEALFPEKPGEGTDWSAGLASEMLRLRRSLQENGHTFQTAAWPLAETPEGERWAALAQLERLVEAKLSSWKFKSRSRALTEGIQLPAGKHIVLAGIAEMSPLLERSLLEWTGSVTALIGAPSTLEDEFSLLGKPLASWTARTLPWPDAAQGSVKIVADPRQQASAALDAVARGGRPSTAIALGSADTETGDELQRTFTRAGWIAFHPAATAVTSGLGRWFGVWRKWLADPQLAVLADLLALPETGPLVGGKRAQKANRLAELRDRWMIARSADLEHRIATADFRKDWEKEASLELLDAAKRLETFRNSLLAGDFTGNLKRLLEALSKTGPATQETAVQMLGWLDEAAPLIAGLNRSAASWIDLMVSQFPPPAPAPPAGRVIDVQGWLEIFHEPGAHLVLCGLNEGKVPARGGGEPWLSETIRGRLGLTRDDERAARDAFLFQAIIEARLVDGRVDLICGKAGAGGESLLPSRFLLAAEKADLPERVGQLFREVEPPEAGLRWEADWQWQPRKIEPPPRVSVTALRDYLKCPFRYYLKHVVRMQSPAPGRTEWDARDFGNVAHEILERWGRDEEARDFSKSEFIESYFSDQLDRIVDEWFGKNVPLAIRIQREAMRQRLAWLARRQACERAEGWKIIDVERKVELEVSGLIVTAKIDRIDRHSDGRVRVIDYKTGKVASVDQEHRTKINANTILPAHLDLEGPAVYEGVDKQNSASFLWKNLQLPLYVAAVRQNDATLAIPAYFTLGSTEAEVAMHEWASFSEDDLTAAETCADWIVGKIAEGVFWPPAEKVTYDDYSILAAGKDLVDMVRQPV